ncbi:uncharacterized protein LOC118648879 [Monomorium pharaonis]|uniref:uncharacterized protein LOC118648879 n=1 Tax=Monomorium pharaonis TaxID=307658 RepID=UPI001745D858|nr:uncharacterized protein LOC118648879 [Monomorium pharaonis]
MGRSYSHIVLSLSTSVKTIFVICSIQYYISMEKTNAALEILNTTNLTFSPNTSQSYFRTHLFRMILRTSCAIWVELNIEYALPVKCENSVVFYYLRNTSVFTWFLHKKTVWHIIYEAVLFETYCWKLTMRYLQSLKRPKDMAPGSVVLTANV